MSIRCLVGVHRPSLSAITRRNGGYATLCEDCARPLEREAEGRWAASEPLYNPRQGRAA